MADWRLRDSRVRQDHLPAAQPFPPCPAPICKTQIINIDILFFTSLEKLKFTASDIKNQYVL